MEAQILNLDKNAISFNGDNARGGGKITMVFVDGRLPAHGLASSKTLQSTTLITGKDSLNNVLPPHYQCIITETTNERENIHLKTVRFIKGV